jgi:hypothetical protein
MQGSVFFILARLAPAVGSNYMVTSRAQGRGEGEELSSFRHNAGRLQSFGC